MNHKTSDMRLHTRGDAIFRQVNLDNFTFVQIQLSALNTDTLRIYVKGTSRANGLTLFIQLNIQS